MGKIVKTGNDEFLKSAETLLRNGLPSQALDKLYIYRDDSTDQAVLSQKYYTLRALAGFLLADKLEQSEDAMGYLKDGGGPTEEFLKLYEEAASAYFARTPRFSRTKIKQSLRLHMNRAFHLTLCEELQIDPMNRSFTWPSASR